MTAPAPPEGVAAHPPNADDELSDSDTNLCARLREAYLEAYCPDDQTGPVVDADLANEAAARITALRAEVERLRRYNPPDRTIDEQRQIAVDIAEVASALEAMAREREELVADRDSWCDQADMHAKTAVEQLTRADAAEAERDKWKQRCGDANEWGLIHTARWKTAAEVAEAERYRLRERCKELHDHLSEAISVIDEGGTLSDEARAAVDAVMEKGI